MYLAGTYPDAESSIPGVRVCFFGSDLRCMEYKVRLPFEGCYVIGI